MEETLDCPRCGTKNDPRAMNCRVCHINLKFALENPSELDLLARIKPLRNNAPSASSADGGILLKTVLLLLGSFTFAFLLGEGVHESGHALAHYAYGYPVSIVLDPFGGSYTAGGSSPETIWGPTTLAGPLLNLVLALLALAFVWRRSQPIWLPLLLWGPVACIQEGVTFSLGMLTPGGDADLLVRWGFPAALLIGIGVLLLITGVALIAWLLPVAGIAVEDSTGRKFVAVAGGMVSFMILRLLGSTMISPSNAVENVIPLIFAVIQTGVVVHLVKPLHQLLGPTPRSYSSVRWATVVFSLAMGGGMMLFQLAVLN